MQARIGDKILTDGGGNGADITDMLHHGCQSNGSDGHNGGQQQTAVEILTENGEGGVLPDDGQAEPLGLGHRSHNIGPGAGIHNQGKHIGYHHAQQNGNDLHHALAPDVAGNHNQDRNDGNQPVGAAVVDGGAGQRQADADDDRTGDDGREETHDFPGAENLKQGSQYQVDKTGHSDAEAGIGQKRIGRTVLQHGSNRRVASQEGKGGAQEGRDLPSGEQMEQQGTEAGEQQRGGDIQTGDGRDKDRCAEHSEQVLDTQNQDPGGAQSLSVIYGFRGFFRIHWKTILSIFIPGISILLFPSIFNHGSCHKTENFHAVFCRNCIDFLEKEVFPSMDSLS